jgi:hypothetical protein
MKKKIELPKLREVTEESYKKRRVKRGDRYDSAVIRRSANPV